MPAEPGANTRSSAHRCRRAARVARLLELLLVSTLVAICVRSRADTSPTRSLRQHERLEIEVDDGALLRGHRWVAPGTPVILVHGLFASLHQFDLDEPGSPSLARTLHESGLDVWLLNLRGAGRVDEESLLPPGEGDWTADDHVLHDLPAMVERVTLVTGRRPLLLGHSLGGMVIAAWLAGAERAESGGGDPAGTVRISAARARERQRAVRGAVLIAAPARLRWPEAETPKVVSALAELGRGPLRHLLPRRLPASRLGGDPAGDDAAWMEKLSGRAERALARALEEADWPRLVLGEQRATVAERLLKKLRGEVLSDASRGVLLQLAQGVGEGTWPSSGEEAAERVDYATGYGNITTPVLLVVGRRDRFASPEITKAELYDRLGSRQRCLVIVPGYGHSDITLGPDAHRDVFRPVAAWIHATLEQPPEERSSPPRGAPH